MRVKKNLDHLLYGIGFSILGTIIGLFLIEAYWLFKGYKFGTVWDLLSNPALRINLLTLSQTPNVLVFYFFFQSKRDRSAYGVILFFLILAIPIAIQKLL